MARCDSGPTDARRRIRGGQKRHTALVEASHKVLVEQLTAHMLHMSTLQHLLPQSPVYAVPMSLDMFTTLHTPLHLRDVTNDERVAQLSERGELSLRAAPSLVDRFTAYHVAAVSSAVPFTRTSLSAHAHFTYMATVFIARLSHVSVAQVHAVVLGFCENVYSELAQRYNVVHELKVHLRVYLCVCVPVCLLNCVARSASATLSMRQPIHKPSCDQRYSQVRSSSPTGFASVSYSAFAARSDGEFSGTVVMDFVDRDDRFPDVSNAFTTYHDVTQMCVFRSHKERVPWAPGVG